LGEDQQKAKEAEPLLVRMQRVSDIKHEKDYDLNRSLRSQLRVRSNGNLSKGHNNIPPKAYWLFAQDTPSLIGRLLPYTVFW
jgi:coiled-coil domain-containing protein 130